MTKPREEERQVLPWVGQNAAMTGHLFRMSSFVFRSSFEASNFVLLISRALLFILAINLTAGCVASHPNAKPVTDVDSKLGLPDYWWSQPAVVHVPSADFQKLWDACKGELYVRLFPVDREQYRDGLLTSEPVVSKQFFELWRTDAVNVHDVAESSVGTIRRTIHFEVTRNNDGSYEMAPKVLVERFQSTERRLTAITQYHESFSAPRAYSDLPDESGAPAGGADYWYAVRRDNALEKDLANSIRHRLGQ